MTPYDPLHRDPQFNRWLRQGQQSGIPGQLDFQGFYPRKAEPSSQPAGGIVSEGLDTYLANFPVRNEPAQGGDALSFPKTGLPLDGIKELEDLSRDGDYFKNSSVGKLFFKDKYPYLSKIPTDSNMINRIKYNYEGPFFIYDKY